MNDPRLVALAAARDSSLPLAAAALVQIADDRGQAQFGSLAVDRKSTRLNSSHPS